MALAGRIAVIAAASVAFGSTASGQTFKSEGPAPSQGNWETIQSRDLPALGEGTVAGAIQAVLPDPNNPSRIFIGSVNGGIWGTNTNGATWTPLTDNASSLSIASLSFDPSNSNVIIAGIGNTSNGGVGSFESGKMTGLLYSNNGGSSWSTIDRGLAGKSIVAAAINGTTILAASANPNSLRSGGGLYISTAGGNFTAVNGVPTGAAVTSLAADSGSPNTYYASVAGFGLYRSVNGGVDWEAMTIPGLVTTAYTKVVTGKIPGSVVVASYSGKDVTGISLSVNGGADWTALPVPTPNTGQASTNLALAIDPNNANIVYFGGAASSDDRQWTLAAYKLTAGSDSFTPITLNGTADNSAPHADARIFVFDQNGRMLMGGDGGVYALNSTASGLSWTGLNTSALSVREANAIAYDAISHRIIVASQDTGAAVQDSRGSAGYTAVQPADGTNAQVNDVTLKSQGLSAVYTSWQGLGGLMRQTYNASGALIGTQAFNTGSSGANRLNFEQDDYKVDETETDDEEPGAKLPHFSMIVLNKVDPTRIAFGTNYVYTTQDVGAQAKTLTLINRGVAGSPIGEVRALAYGTLDSPFAVLAATGDSRLYLSTSEQGDTLEQLTSYPVSNLIPTSVVFDTRFVNSFYVANGGTLQGTANRGVDFTDLTPKLATLGIERPLALDFISTNGVNALLVGGLRTAAGSRSPLASVEADAGGNLIDATWRAFGNGLPNTQVSALAYNPAADALIASLWGRGVWSLYDVTSNFASATVLQFGLADNNSNPDASLLTGARPLIKYGSGTLTIAGPATYSGGTTIKDGTVLLTGAGTLGDAAGATTLEAGLLDLGGTTQVQNGGLTLKTGTIQNGVFQSNGAFALQDGTIAAVLDGTGSLTKSGGGTVVLSGVNTYTSSTTVTGGTLRVDGSIAASSALTVGADGAFFGTGTLPVTVVDGYIASATPGSTLTVNTGYTQTAGSTYGVAATAGGVSDRINVNGPAALAGTVAVSPAAGAYGNGKTFTILTASSITGSYDGATSTYAFLQPTLSYGASNVLLTLTPGGFSHAAVTPNQMAVANVLDDSVATASGDFLNVIDAFALMTPDQAKAAFQAISGQNYAGFSSAAMQGTQLFMNSFQIQAGGGAGSSNSAGLPGGSTYMALKADDCDNACDVEPLWGAWGGGTAAFGTVAGNTNSNGLTYNLGGFIAGLDRKFVPGFRAGIATGFNAATLYTNGMPGTGWSNTVQVALYGEYLTGPVYLDALAGYGHSDNRMNRPITLPGLPSRLAQGSTTANTFFGQIETGYKIPVAPRFGGFVTPFARLQASTSTQAGFSETGADSLNLTVAQQTTNSLRTVLGAQIGAGIDAPWREKLDLVFRLGWSHEFADTTRPVTAAFAGAPALSFTTFGASAPRDGVVLGLGANTAIAERTSLYLRYDGDLAGGNTNHVLNAGIRYVW